MKKVQGDHFLIFLSLLLMWQPSLVAAVGQPVRIAAIFALTGQAKEANVHAIKGVEIAINEINTAGGLLGQGVELVIVDNQSTPIGSKLAAERAVALGVSAIIGAGWSSHSLAVARVAEQNNIPMISPHSTTPPLTSIGPNIFRVCFSDEYQGVLIADFALTELQASRALVFVDLTSDYSLELSRVFNKHFREYGGEIVAELEYKSTQMDFERQVDRARRLAADVVLLSGHDESGLIAAKLQAAKVRAIPIGGDGWGVKSFFTLGGSQLQRGYYICHWSPLSQNPVSQAFMRKYGPTTTITEPLVLSYDAVSVLAEAIRLAGSGASQAVRRQLAKLDNYQGVTGNLSFDEQGNAIRGACVSEIRNGKPFFMKSFQVQ